ncbi:MAG: CBS domain-containing protein [Gammaproteobacteria bacterium]|nr:CBS domain-containing protein [Gammaproteobacteria bacterium]
MATIRQLLDSKGHEVFSLGPDASVFDAIEMMATRGVGALLVLEHSRIVGIISERDYARKVVLRGRVSKSTWVGDIMTSPVITSPSHLTVEEAMAVMTERRIRHLPVVDDGRLLGVVSVGDLVKSIIAEQQFVISQLQNYIHS